MMWPTLIVDNFFDDPEKVINFFLNNLAIKRDPQTPLAQETRTASLDKINKEFFDWSTKKIMMLLFPMKY